MAGKRSNRWTREEHILALNMYLSYGEVSPDEEIVVELSDLLRTLNDPEASARLVESEYEIHGATEAELWETLDRQRIRARTAEELVVTFEKERLVMRGEPGLSSLVKRVSEYDVSAGYDVRSFDPNTGEIFIEVKSSVSSRLRFYWSPNEKEMAKEKAQQYWIYFVPRVRESMCQLQKLIVINDPVSKIGSVLSEVPSNFEVTMSGSSSVGFQEMIGSTQVNTIR